MGVRSLVALAALVALSGCSAFGVPYSSDPEVKFAQARTLEEQGRFLPALNVLRDALDIYEKRGDQRGIAEAYRQLGFLYRAPITRPGIAPDDFGGTTDGIPNRYLRSTEYFRKSAELYEKVGDLAAMSNLSFVMAQNYIAYLNDKATGCQLLDRSQELHHRALQRNPDLKVGLLPGYSSFDEGMEAFKRRYCA